MYLDVKPNYNNTVEGELKLINEQLHRLNTYLIDDHLTGELGLVSRVRSHKDKIEKLELKEKIRDVRAGLWGAVATGGIFLIKFLFEFFKSRQ